MKPADTLAALAVAIVWGLTFIAIKVGVGETPPLMFSALRFAFAALPMAFLVRPPAAKPGIVALYGMLIGVGQFGGLFLAVRAGFPVGLASVVVQLQAFVTILLASWFLGERILPAQRRGAIVAFFGIAVIGAARFSGAALGPFLLVVGAAICWGVGNIVAKRAGRVDMLAFTVWSSLAPPLPLFLLSLAIEPGALASLGHPSLKLVLSVLAVAYAGTVFGFGIWSRLLSHYSAGAVAPFALLVPVVGMAAGPIVFGETVRAIELAGAVLVMAGLAINIFGERIWPSARERISHARHQSDPR